MRIKIQISIKLKAYFRNDIIKIKTVDLKNQNRLYGSVSARQNHKANAL